MEIDDGRRPAAVNFMLVAAMLMLVAVGLIFLIAVAAKGIGGDQDAARRHLLLVARVALVMLAFTVVVLFWMGVHFLSTWHRRRRISTSTPYVDAWAEAGQRVELDDEKSDEEP